MLGDPIDALLGTEEQAFRAEVRAFIRDTLPQSARRNADLGRHATKDEVLHWQRALFSRGWAAPTWPKEHGGTGWDPVRLYLFTLECGLGSAPKVPAFGTRMIGPVLYTFGSEAQKSYYLPRILRAEDWWCQGFSEPGAGSDLAALKTRADRVGDRYLVNGQKIWTTKAQYANRMFALVRTSTGARRQEGISMLLIDMDSPGIELRPIIGIDGSHSLNEVFLTDVSVPAENLVGEEGHGWNHARFLLANERSDITGVGRCRRQLARLRALAGERGTEVGLLAQIAEVDIALTALELTELRYLAAQGRGEDIGAGASILKLRGTEIQQDLTRLLREVLGPEALRFGAAASGGAEGIAEEYLYNRASTIYGGSSEIQRGLIGRAAMMEGA